LFVPPREANILVTSKCNLKCRHCSVTSHGRLEGDLSLAQWCRILDHLAENKLLKLVITGGEPFARPDFNRLLQEILKRPFRIDINTNGTLLDKDNVKLLSNAQKRLDYFMIGLDGADEETVDDLRGKGVYKALMKGIENVQRSSVPFGFYCTVHPGNYNQVLEIARMVSRMNTWIKFNPLIASGPGIAQEMFLSAGQLRTASKQAMQAAQLDGVDVSGVVLTVGELIERSSKKSGGPGVEKPRLHCGGLSSKISIFPNGDVTPCDHLPAYRVGNILEAPLRSILESDRAKEFRTFLNTSLDDVEECASCPYRGICLGGCPVIPLREDIDLDRDPFTCLRLILDDE
jgi:radical SAM protein with 4Fe4S-binding SPASM domain